MIAASSLAARSIALTSFGIAATIGLAAGVGPGALGTELSEPTTSNTSPSYGENGSRGCACSPPSA